MKAAVVTAAGERPRVGLHGTPENLVIVGAAGGLAVQNAHTLGVRRIIRVGRGVDDLKRLAGLGAETVELTGDRDPDAAAIAARTTSKAGTPFRRAPR